MYSDVALRKIPTTDCYAPHSEEVFESCFCVVLY